MRTRPPGAVPVVSRPVGAAVGARGAALLAGLAWGSVPAAGAAAELCRYAGTTDHDGRVAVRTEVEAAGGVVTVDVALVLTARAWFSDVRHLAQEISTWRAGELQSVAVNARTIAGGRIRRQQWDVFARGPGGFEAWRVQAKTEADFRRRHPGFAGHWDPAVFGRPWLRDYAAAAPERRPDLDLPLGAAPPGLRTPLALAFYWSRWPPGGGGVPVFLPGFKRDARADAVATPAAPGEGWRSWRTTLRHPGLTGAVPSTVQTWVSPDGYLLQLTFDASVRQGSARGLIRAQGCQGVQIAPMDRAR